MTTLASKTAGSYARDYEALESSGEGVAWAGPARRRAWERLEDSASPFVRRANERWKYTDLRPLAAVPFRLARTQRRLPDLAAIQARAPWDPQWTTLVFVDGAYASALSKIGDGGIVAGNLLAAPESERAMIEPHLAKVQAIDEEYFTLLNTAFLADAAYVRLPVRAAPAQPVHLVFVTTAGADDRATHPRTLVIAGRESQAVIVESYVSLGDSDRHFTNPVAELVLEEGARIEHYRALAENEASFHTGNTRVRQAASSRLNSITFETGPAIGRNDVHVLIDGAGAECNLVGLYMTNGRQHLDNNISVTHEKPHGTSHQYYKGILAGKSHAVFSGIVVVQPGAIKTYADQKDLNLLLSPGAEIDTKPSLEILADDVKCFHGATAGHVDLSTLYYMRSRGIDLETASRMLIRGFAAEIVEQVKPAALVRYIEEVTERMLPGFKVAMSPGARLEQE